VPMNMAVLSKSEDRNAVPAPLPGHNPYLAARKEWDERYGDLISRARNWRMVAIICAATALFETFGMIALALRSKVIPYIVAVDSLGRVAASGIAEQASIADDRIRRAALFQWIGDLRSVTTDGVAQRKAIDRVYSYIANGSPAQTFISEFYRNDPPQKRALTETISVDVQSVLPTSDQTYEIEWLETVRDLQGQIKSQDRWKGAFTIAIHPPDDERLLRVNPLGIFVTNASWSKVL
jgi:type IV secretory pathway TrbF-like protein